MTVEHRLEAERQDVDAGRRRGDRNPGHLRRRHLRPGRRDAADQVRRREGGRTARRRALLFRLDRLRFGRGCRGGGARRQVGRDRRRAGYGSRAGYYDHQLAVRGLHLQYGTGAGGGSGGVGGLSDAAVKSVCFQDELQLVLLALVGLDVALQLRLLRLQFFRFLDTPAATASDYRLDSHFVYYCFRFFCSTRNDRRLFFWHTFWG